MHKITLDLEKVEFIKQDESIDIKFKPGVAEPQNLYKYYSLSERSKDGLKNSTIYFAHSHLLNDVMDGNFMLWNLDKFLVEFKKETNDRTTNSKDILNAVTKPFLEKRGVLSLCDTYKNELIWAHYTGETGYCIELETEKLKACLDENRNPGDLYFFPISYGKLKQINFSEYISSKIIPKNQFVNSKTIDSNLAILYCFAQKDECWEYETEWRFLLRDKEFNSISFPLEIISNDEKSVEDKLKTAGNIHIKYHILKKVILAPLFFNNSRFNKLETVDSLTSNYYFKEDSFGKSLVRDFVTVLKDSYNDKIFQVDKVIKDGFVIRDIKYKIEILEVGNEYVKINKVEI